MANKQCYYRVATSEAGLDTGYFLARGLPPPDLVTFDSFSTRRPASQGGESRQGYRSCSVLWNRLDSLQASIIYDIIEAAETTGGEGNGTLWLTLPRTDGSAVGQNWVDVSGIALLPAFETEPQSNGRSYPNVVLRLNNVTVQNEPSNIFA